MNAFDIANGLIFEAMSIGKETFSQRLISQKKIYLLQELGLDLGYPYSWYIHGPYSSNLTTYLYNNADIFREYPYDGYTLSPAAQDKVDRVNGLAGSRPDNLSEEHWYELLASIHYIYKKLNVRREDLPHKLQEFKPQFDHRENFEAALAALGEPWQMQASEAGHAEG